MITDDPPNDISSPKSLLAIAGTIVSRAKQIEPIKVILVDTVARKSLVGLPGLMPGTKPPFCCNCFAYSTVLN